MTISFCPHPGGWGVGDLRHVPAAPRLPEPREVMEIRGGLFLVAAWSKHDPMRVGIFCVLRRIRGSLCSCGIRF